MHIGVLLLLSTLFLSACAGQHYEDGSSMEVSVNLTDVHRCSRISPEIEIFDAPKDTALYEVLLEDIKEPSRMHGGGFWAHDDSGIIPEGALTRHYTGACPPADTDRTYQYVVKALDVNNRLLAVRKYIFEQD